MTDSRDKALHPQAGEIWHHPLTRSQYVIHSLSDDGWVRYYLNGFIYPVYTKPTLKFIDIYERLVK